MPNIAQAVPMQFIVETVLIIFVVIAIGIIGVKRGKKMDKETSE